MDIKAKAIQQHLKEEHGAVADVSDLVPESYDDCLYDLARITEVSRSWGDNLPHDGYLLVLTESERDERWNECLDNYIDECILDELPEQYRPYFDDEKWKRDARFDGAGVSLAGWDHQEHEYQIDGEWIYIYRN